MRATGSKRGAVLRDVVTTGGTLRPLILDSLLTLSFFGLLASFVEATYTFGLLGTDIPPEIVYVLFLLSPVLLLVFPRLLDSRAFAYVTGALGLVGWAVSLPLGTRWRMLAAGIGCGMFLLFIPARLRQFSGRNPGRAAGVGLGVLLLVLLRALRSGNLVLSGGAWLLIGAGAAAAAICLLLLSRPGSEPSGSEPSGSGSPGSAATQPGRVERAGSWRTLGLSLGLFAALTLLYFGFTSPAVIARWGEAGYPLVTAAAAGALALFVAAWLISPVFRAWISPRILLAWNTLFLLALAYALLSRQPRFSPGSVYPLYAPSPGLLSAISFWAMVLLHPVIYADIARVAGALRAAHPSPRALAGGVAVGALCLLLLTFSQIFTTVYDYIPVIGPWFRDRFWLVVCAPALIVTLAALLAGPSGEAEHRRPAARVGGAVGAVVLAAAAVLAAGLTGARPAAVEAGGSLRVMTWNIQQGVGKTGEMSIESQREVISSMQPDVLGLQETDTARIAGGNSDLVRFLADGLGMYSYYGPSPVSGTFGIALLSRYPLREPRTFFMPSRGEQTAAIEADIQVGGRLFRVLVTHLDNDGAIAQQRVLLGRASAGEAAGAAVIAMGDFNFAPSTDQYRLSTAALDDAWLQARRRTVRPGAPDPAGRIDHIFLSRGTRVGSAEYLPEGPSDHPAMAAVIDW